MPRNLLFAALLFVAAAAVAVVAPMISYLLPDTPINFAWFVLTSAVSIGLMMLSFRHAYLFFYHRQWARTIAAYKPDANTATSLRA